MINDGDKIIREQIGAIEAGSENIVFDKAAAWERLHAKMEQRPARVIPYRWAAAAAILLLITTGIMFINRNTEKNIAVVNKVNPIMQDVKQPTIQETVAHQETANTKFSPRTIKKKNVEKNVIETPAPEPEVISVVNNNPAIPQQAMPITTAPKMKVVHINDLMSEENQNRILSNTYVGDKGIHFFRPAIEPGYIEIDISKPSNPFKISLTQN